MGVMDKLKDWLGKGAEEEVRLTEAKGVTIDNDEEGFRKLTGDSSRDLNPLAQGRQQELALYLWKPNPLANRLIELPVAYLLAEGVKLTVDDVDAQSWLDKFWRDPINAMNIKLPKKVRELALYGEQCWPTFVNEMNGDVRLGYLDPGLIKTVVTDPDNIEQPIGIVTPPNKKGKTYRYKIIINGSETVFSKRTQEIRESFDDGECFYFKANDLSNAKRGHSDMLSQMDWLDGYDQSMFGELDRWDSLRSFLWDVTMKGATPEEVLERARKIEAPKPGSVRVHNDAEVWQAVTPGLNAGDTDKIARMMRNQALGGGTIPEHWFGGGGDVNRATASEMGEPTLKVFTMKQSFWGYVLEEIGTYVIRQKALSYYGSDPYEQPDAELYVPEALFPELTSRDTSSYATAFQQVVIGCVTAIDQKLLTHETAIGIIATVSVQLGQDIDVKDELEKVRVLLSKESEDDSFSGHDPDKVDDGK